MALGKTEQFQIQIEAKQEEMIPWTEKVNSKQSQIDIATMEYNLLEEKINHVRNEVEKGNLRAAELKEQGSTVKIQMKDLKKELATCSNRLESFKAQVEVIPIFKLGLNSQYLCQQCRSREESAKSNWIAARQAVDDAKSVSESNESRGHLYTQLMRQSETGRIRGICVWRCIV
jgi:structural maintenance of chromosome 4